MQGAFSVKCHFRARESTVMAQPKPPPLPRLTAYATIASPILIALIGGWIAILQMHSTESLTAGQQKISQELNQITRERNAAYERLERGKLASDLLKQLLDSKGQHRAAILVMLEPYMPGDQYTNLLAALAKEDAEKAVRITAIKQLAKSTGPVAAAAAKTIAKDTERPEPERTAAAQTSSQIDKNDKDLFSTLRKLANKSSSIAAGIAPTVAGECKALGPAKAECANGEGIPVLVKNEGKETLYATFLELRTPTQIVAPGAARAIPPASGTIEMLDTKYGPGTSLFKFILSKQPLDIAQLITQGSVSTMIPKILFYGKSYWFDPFVSVSPSDWKVFDYEITFR
jgi:hypothetical protein